MAKVTVKELENLKEFDDGKRLRDDDNIIGKVRVGERGISVHFSIRYRFGGKTKEFALGTWRKDQDHPTLSEIRATAASVRESLSKKEAKADPIAEKRLKEQAEAQRIKAEELKIAKAKAENEQLKAELEALKVGLTLSGLVDDWIRKDRAVALKDGGAEVRRSFTKDLLPELGAVLVKDLTRGMIARQLDNVKARSPVIARYLLADLRLMFKWAIKRDYCEVDPTYLLELKDFGVKGERDRVLSDAELRELFKALPSAKLPQHSEKAILIMLSTCCRVGEISQAKWSDINFEQATWTIPKATAKNSKEHVITLSAFAVACFEAIKATQEEQAKKWERDTLPAFVIPSDDWTTHIDVKAITKQVKDRQREIPLKGRAQGANKALVLAKGDWTPHDLRRTGATLMRSMGIDSDVIEKCLNHVKKDVLKRIYQRPDLSREMAQAWQALGDRLELLTTDNVIVLTPNKSAKN